MDEATRTVFSRIQSIDPENATKVIGFILIQDQGEKEITRLAFSPENHLLAVINMARTELGLLSSSNPSSSSSSSSVVPSTSSPSPFSSNPIPVSRPTPLSLSLPSPTFLNNTGGLFNPTSPSSPSVWSMAPGGSIHHPHPHPLGSSGTNPSPSLSYAAVVNGNEGIISHDSFSSPSPLGGGGGFATGGSGDTFMDDYYLRDQTLPFVSDPSLALQQHQSSVDFSAMSPGRRSDSVLYPYWENNGHAGHGTVHRRSCSFNDACFGGADDSASGIGGYKSCLYYNRGFCKNGGSCKFIHGGGGGFGGGGDVCDGPNSAIVGGSPCKFDAFEQCHQDLIRSKIAQQQRLANAQLMAGMNSPYNKLNFMQSEAQRSAATAMLMGEEFHKFNRARSPRHDFSAYGGDDSSSSARQIYLTFPADSTFREDDVSNYFSMYGPVQDVRIPYQQKRMFGFVTFVYAETVKRILGKGNPHFVCDSRVLVKPYKEKGKLADKKRGESSSCTSSSEPDYREPYEQLQVGPRMFYNTHEMYRKKLEEQALELQTRRMMNLQLLELKNQQLDMSVGSPLSSPSLSRAAAFYQNFARQPNGIIQDALEEGSENPIGGAKKGIKEEGNAAAAGTERSVGSDGGVAKNKEEDSNEEVCDLPEGFEHILPENLFASPTKSGAENRSVFSAAVPAEAIDVAATSTSTSAAVAAAPSTANAVDHPLPPSLGMGAPLTSCFLEMPRFSSGHGAVGM